MSAIKNKEWIQFQFIETDQVKADLLKTGFQGEWRLNKIYVAESVTLL